MAKKDKKAADPEAAVSITDLTGRVCTEIRKTYGDGVLISGDDAVNAPRTVIPISPALNIITSGGIIEGSWVGITGDPKTGKTNMALTFAANCQRPEYGSRPIYYIMAEGRLSTAHLRQIEGLDLSPGKFGIVRSHEGKILFAQDFLRITSNIIASVPGAVIIIDSATALCNEEEMVGGMGTQLMGGGNKLFTQFVRTNNQIVPVNRAIVLVISHLAVNIGWPGKSEKTAKMTQYQYDYMLRTTKKEAWKAGEKQIGFIVNWVCNCTPLGSPTMKIDSYLRFGVGVDRVYELVNFACAVGLITGKGYYTLDFMALPQHRHLLEKPDADPPKFHGAEKLYRALKDRPEWAAALEQEVMGIAGTLAESGGE